MAQARARVHKLASCRVFGVLSFTFEPAVYFTQISMLRCLPPFPILIDYRAHYWPVEEENLAHEALLEALGHRGRVRGVALRSPDSKILGALSHPFPELESLEVCHNPTDGRLFDPNYQPDDESERILPATLLSGSAPCLRRLTLRRITPDCLPPLLSFAMGLIELALTFNTLPPEALLLPNLQRMSCLRSLELKVIYGPSITQDIYDRDLLPPAYSGDVVPLGAHAHHLQGPQRSLPGARGWIGRPMPAASPR